MASLPFAAREVRAPRNAVLHGDCVEIMAQLPEGSVDFILTDPPYVVNYRPRSGARVANDNSADWVRPTCAEMHRVLKPGGLCVSFYGWPKADLFIAAWNAAGFRMVGHIVFVKRYASSRGFLQSQHEMTYVLAKGDAVRPERPIGDVIEFAYTGNRLHPTQKPVAALRPLIESFTRPGQLVLDPFCGSGSTLIAAKMLGRDWLGIELDARHCRTARDRMR
jgi:adenine-specific DNA-methyltransferase